MVSSRALLLVSLAATVWSCGPPEPYVPELTVWSEYLAPAEVKAQLPFLARHRVALNLAVEQGTEMDGALLEVLAAAAQARVPVRLWPLVPKDQGYWVNEYDLAAVDAHVTALLDRLEGQPHSVVAVVFDLEPAIQRVEELQRIAASGDTVKVVDFLRAARDPAHLTAARTALRATVERVHARGFEAHASTLVPLLDAPDAPGAVEDLLDTPVRGIAWDRLSFQVYRSWFDLYFGSFAGGGGKYTPDLIASYAATALAQWGDRGAIDLGLINPPGAGPFEDALELQADVSAALAAGVPWDKVQLYSLDGLSQHDDAAAWLERPTDPQLPSKDVSTDNLRSLFALLAGF